MQFISFVRSAVTTFTLAAACVLPAHAAGTWETTLLGRDINLNAVGATDASAVYLYDTTLNVTWLRNANVNGAQTWANATAWADSLSTGSGGNTISDWRLPTMSNGSTESGYSVSASSSEMASLFHSTLGNTNALTNVGSFQNLQSTYYWLGTEYAPNTIYAWYFNTFNSRQNATSKNAQLYALAVRPGDVVAQVPEPETYLMLLLGLGLVGAISRRRSRVVRPLAH